MQTRRAIAKSRASFKTLVLHLLASFLGGDVAAKRLLQLAVALVLPALLYVLAVLPSYNGLMPMFQLRPMRQQVADHFVLITYAYCVTGLAAIFAWQRFFPTLEDIRILGVLPISTTRLFTARLCASAAFFLLLFVVPNAFPALLLLGGAGSAHPFRQMLAHAASLSLASVFAASSVLILLMLSRIHPLAESLMQGILLAAHTMMLLVCPKASLQAFDLVQNASLTGRFLPPIWFTAFYEAIWHEVPVPAFTSVLAKFAVRAALLTAALLLFAYPLAYWRQERRLIEGQYARRFRGGTAWSSKSVFRKAVLPSSGQLAGFFFAHKTMLRVRALRIVLVLALSSAAALAAVTSSHHGLLPATSELGLEAVLLLAGGIFAAFATQHEPEAAWIFEIADPSVRTQVVDGSRRWLMIAAALGSTVLVATVALIGHSIPIVAIVLPVAAWLASEYLFLHVWHAPFTRNDLLNQPVLRKLAILLLLLLPLSILAMHRRWAATLLLAAVIALWAARRSAANDLEEPIVFEEDFIRLGL